MSGSEKHAPKETDRDATTSQIVRELRMFSVMLTAALCPQLGRLRKDRLAHPRTLKQTDRYRPKV